jgi:hypothetical protein
VKRDLDAFGNAPVEPMPAHFAAQLDAAIAAEATKTRPAPVRAPSGMAPVVDMADARRRRNRRMGWAAGVLTAAAAAVAVTFVALPGDNSTGGTPQAGDAGSNTSQVEPGGSAPGDEPPVDGNPTITDLQGHKDYGPLDTEEGLKTCLSDKGIESSQVMGAREIKLTGTTGVAALLAGGDNGAKFRIVVVDSDCSKIISNTSLG